MNFLPFSFTTISSVLENILGLNFSVLLHMKSVRLARNEELF